MSDNNPAQALLVHCTESVYERMWIQERQLSDKLKLQQAAVPDEPAGFPLLLSNNGSAAQITRPLEADAISESNIHDFMLDLRIDQYDEAPFGISNQAPTARTTASESGIPSTPTRNASKSLSQASTPSSSSSSSTATLLGPSGKGKTTRKKRHQQHQRTRSAPSLLPTPTTAKTPIKNNTKRPKNAFFLWKDEHKAEIINVFHQKYGPVPVRNDEYARLAGYLWKLVSGEERREYQRRSKELHKKHREENPGFVWMPVYAGEIPRNRRNGVYPSANAQSASTPSTPSTSSSVAIATAALPSTPTNRSMQAMARASTVST
eukprot:jgi/Hompol1/1390/HPOL_000061-RA